MPKRELEVGLCECRMLSVITSVCRVWKRNSCIYDDTRKYTYSTYVIYLTANVTYVK